ncbi:MAG: SpoIID/LytB domain-containing protein [Prochlorococcus sp.]|nr:SpoIID/LytB domain-containing protein [Prochlorococcaceae cyanobacterium Fu_MAG_50]
MARRAGGLLNIAAAAFVGGVLIHGAYAWLIRSESIDQDPGNALLIEAMLEGSDTATDKSASEPTSHPQRDRNQQPRQRTSASPKLPPPGTPLSLSIRVALLSQRPPTSLRLQGPASCHNDSFSQLSQDQLNALLRKPEKVQIHCRTGINGRILLNDRAYEQEIHILNRGDGLLAVNQLDLERYVASVVGAEMPSHWHHEALKAQAVAARSYALAHIARPADPDFDLGDTTRWQAYGGLSTQTTTTRAASEATQGIVLSYKGGIVESLYAATASISYEAHRHLGASMSQHGAQSLANQGLKFNEILGSYYVGAALARLQSRDN